MDVERYRSEGFCVVPGVVASAKVDELRREAEELVALCQRERERLAARIEWESSYTNAGARTDAVETIRKIEPVSDLSEVFDALAHDPGVAGPAEAVLGPVELFEDKLNLKLAGGSGFPWHQDWSCCWRAHTDELATCFLALDATDESNGCLRVLPASHLGKRIYAFRAGSDFEVGRDGLDDAHALAVPLQPGDLLIFDPYLLHMSARNPGPAPRRTIIYTYNPARLGRLNQLRFPADFAAAPAVRL